MSPSELLPSELLTEWQSQSIDSPKISIEYFRYRVSELERHAQRKKAIISVTYVWWAILLAWATFNLGQSWFAKAICISGLYLGLQLIYLLREAQRSGHPLFGPVTVPEFQSGLDALTFYRSELQWLRVDKEKRWRRILASLPVPVIILVGEVLGNPALADRALIPQILFISACIIFGTVSNRRALAKLDDEIQALQSLR